MNTGIDITIVIHLLNYQLSQKRNVKELIEELLDEIYSDHRDWSRHSAIDYSHGYNI